MKRLLLFFLVFILSSVFLGCSSFGNDEEQYSILVVEGNENMSGVFGKYASNDYPVKELEYIVDLEVAKEKYPHYEIEKAPAIFIFSTFGEVRGLELKTYDIDEAIQFLEDKKIERK
ncbi:hypothetical protein [Bacillus sp. FJAT-45037]|uniref:hypothetical protein n=1 Tax=Bacillus sp. FJAT-45037 TaxID=2011007 RepID=UPI000C2375D6|nr:hypothetical protein [Bacillus sp. FJAT-45037]